MDTKILKLTNGDEIITTLSAKSDNTVVTAHNPLKINSYPRMTKGGVEESMALSRWVSYGENDSCEIVKNNIAATAKTNPKRLVGHDYCVLRMKQGKSAQLASQEPTDEQLQRIEDELNEDLFDEYDDDIPKTIH